MQNNKVLKKLLAVSAVAAMFTSFGVHAQDMGAREMIGKTTRDGTVGNTDSQGMEDRSGVAGLGAAGSTSTEGSSGATGASQSGSGGATGTTDSQGMDQRTDQTGSTSGTGSMAGSSGTSGTSAAGQGSSGTGTAGQDSMGASGQAGATGTAGQGGSMGTGSSGQAGAGAGAAGTGAAATGAAATGGAAAAGSLGKTDQNILTSIARSHIAEIEAGKLALSKSQNEDVKKFAQQMVDDHGKALSDLQAVAQAKGVTLPTEPDAKHKAMAAKLEKMSGDAFDKSYMKEAGVKDHKQDLAKLRKDAKRAKDPDVKALVEKLTPVIEQHLKSAQQMSTAKSGTTSGK